MRNAWGYFAWIIAGVHISACSDADDEQAGGALQGSTRVATWGTSPQDYNEVFPGGLFPPPMPLSFDDQSIRQVARISKGGTGPRLRLSNLFGTTPLAIAGAHVAVSLGGSRIDPATDKAVRFNGQSSANIAAGAELWSDPADLTLADGADLAITLYVSEATPVTTIHAVAQQTTFA